MKASAGGPEFEPPREHHFGPAALLAFAVHIALVAALVFGVHWQSRAPDVVTVELWRPPSEPAPLPDPPKVEPPAPPKPAPPPAKPEPRIDKPDIALKEKPKPKPKPPPPKPAPKSVAKPEPDDTHLRQLLAEALQREQTTLAAERERQAFKEQLAREAAAARNRELDTYIAKIRARIRNNFNVSLLVEGNPEATVLVTQLPTGDILDAKLVIPSGNQAYDDDVLRAILKSSPLPKPDSPALFQRTLKLTFRPKD